MTEKNYNQQQQTAKTMQKQEKAASQKVEVAPISKEEKKEIIKDIEKGGVPENVAKREEKIAEETEKKFEKKEETKPEEKETKVEQKEEKKEKKQEKKIVKKDEAVVRGVSLPISTKTSAAICKFIRGKRIERAIADLEEVLKFKRVIPMTGEIPHKKGKGIMSGRYPIRAIGYFIKMLKNLQANAIVNGLEEGIIIEAIPNRASQPYGRGGAIRRKRTHVKIKVAEKKLISKEKK